jgi:hypothetical protein
MLQRWPSRPRQVKALPPYSHIADVEDHLGSGGFGGGMDLVGVVDDEVDAFGLAQADFVGLEPLLWIPKLKSVA